MRIRYKRTKSFLIPQSRKLKAHKADQSSFDSRTEKLSNASGSHRSKQSEMDESHFHSGILIREELL